jgi:hypothetical protein
MKPSTKKQIKNGLRIGGGIGAFWIAAMLIGVTLDGLQSEAPGHLQFWPDVAIAGGLLLLAAVILLLTARAWVLYVAGCLLFAIPKIVIVLASGKDFYTPHGLFSRWEAVELLFFALASLFLMYRMLANHIPTMFDRLALTLYVIALAFSLSRHSSFAPVWSVIALTALFVAWYLSHKKHKRRITNSLGTAE